MIATHSIYGLKSILVRNDNFHSEKLHRFRVHAARSSHLFSDSLSYKRIISCAGEWGHPRISAA